MRARSLEASSDIKLGVGDQHEIVLDSPGGTGYVWELEVDAPPNVLEVQFGESTPLRDEQSGGLANFSSKHTYVIKALAPGSGEVRFLLRRPWQKTAPPAQVKLVRVTIDT